MDARLDWMHHGEDGIGWSVYQSLSRAVTTPTVGKAIFYDSNLFADTSAYLTEITHLAPGIIEYNAKAFSDQRSLFSNGTGIQNRTTRNAGNRNQGTVG